MLIFTGFNFDIAYCKLYILLTSIIAALPTWRWYTNLLFPQIWYSTLFRRPVQVNFFQVFIIWKLEKNCGFWVYCTALLLTSSRVGKARRRRANPTQSASLFRARSHVYQTYGNTNMQYQPDLIISPDDKLSDRGGSTTDAQPFRTHFTWQKFRF